VMIDPGHGGHESPNTVFLKLMKQEAQ